MNWINFVTSILPKLLPLLVQAVQVLQSKGLTEHQIAQKLLDHNDPKKPNSSELDG